MSKQFPSIEFYKKKVKERFLDENVNEPALIKAYRFIKEDWEGIALFYLKLGKDIPSDLIKKRDHVILELYEIYSAPNRSMKKSS